MSGSKLYLDRPWEPNDPSHPEGAVLLNVDHPIMQQQVNYWQEKYPDHLTEGIKDEVLNIYGEILVARVAHSESMRAIISS